VSAAEVSGREVSFSVVWGSPEKCSFVSDVLSVVEDVVSTTTGRSAVVFTFFAAADLLHPDNNKRRAKISDMFFFMSDII
jgi:hypothetical protein